MLPSNDRVTMYRMLRYEEDGSAERWNEKRQAWVKLTGRWWRLLEIPMVTLRAHARSGGDPWDADWSDIAGPFKTLREVTEDVEEMMS